MLRKHAIFVSLLVLPFYLLLCLPSSFTKRRVRGKVEDKNGDWVGEGEVGVGWRVETTLSSVWEHGRQFLCTCCKEVTSLRVCTQYQPSGLPRRPSAHVECRRPRQELRQRATSAAAGTAECRRRGAGSSCLAPHTPSHPPTPTSTTARPRSKVTRWSGGRVSRWNEIRVFFCTF